MSESREVSFYVEPHHSADLQRILDRASSVGMKRGRMDLMMDLCATHANGCPLDFGRLAAADDFNLAHDLGGIVRHLDRSTGGLTGHFRPRFSAKTVAA